MGRGAAVADLRRSFWAIKSYSPGASQLEQYIIFAQKVATFAVSVLAGGLTLGWGDDSCCSELFLLVLLGWKHSPMMGPDVGQLMPNGFQVSSPIMRITAKMPANKTRRQLDNWAAEEYSLLNSQSYLHLGSPHVSLTVLCSAFNAFHNLYKKFISLSFNSSAVELCKRGTFMGPQRVSLSSIEQLMRINMD